ncbi:MAG: flagellar biosynthesis protein FlhA [Candidatus Schekmanbacteria bacterium]|nr:flagellar biosynthesis protein FlhA [Candidatus Schekmanbacteria bacterium]
MADLTLQRALNMLSKQLPEQQHLLIPAAIVAILFLMLVPLPTPIMDLFIGINLTISMLVMFVAVYVLRPVEFHVFPSMLLMLTLYRLSLNVASTRLILTRGHEGTDAAGVVIEAFGQFVVGGNYLVGAVMFLVMLAIQYIVINHGATRIAEVTARFTLDAMPGKQMAIDADLNAGIIDETEAKQRREQIRRESEFYGAMDGAVRFVQRDAVASVLITLINIGGGFVIGVLQRGMPIEEALKTFTMLTIGDGLVSAVPALLISVSGALITTRASGERTLGEDIISRVTADPRPVVIAASLLFLFALIPGLPKISFLTLAIAFGGIAYLTVRHHQRLKKTETDLAKGKAERVPDEPERVEALLKVDILGLEVGYGLVPLVDVNQGGDLLDRIRSLRRQLALELGVLVPPIRIRDNLQLHPNQYQILLKGVNIARGEAFPAQFLAMDPGTAREKIEGTETREPAFGLPARWIRADQRERAQFAGYTVVDSATVISTHLNETIKSIAHELLGRQETQALLDNIKQDYPKLVEDLVPGIMGIGVVQKVLQNLLRERVSVRDLRTILEALAEYGPYLKDPNGLTEFVRQELGRAICSTYETDGGELPVITLAPETEQQLAQAVEDSDAGSYLAIAPERAQRLFGSLRQAIEHASLSGEPVLLTSSRVRRHLKSLTERMLPRLAVLAHNEIPPATQVVSLGVVS